MGCSRRGWRGDGIVRSLAILAFFVCWAPILVNPASASPGLADHALPEPQNDPQAEAGARGALMPWDAGRGIALQAIAALADAGGDEGDGDEAALRLAWLAHAEAQGMLAEGTVARLSELHRGALTAARPDNAVANSEATPVAYVVGARGPPENIYRDAHTFCDINADGWNEVIINEFSLITTRSTVRMLDGRTGRGLWVEPFGLWFHFIPQDEREGEPLPQGNVQPRNMHNQPDLNGDGVCDFVIHSFLTQGLVPTGARLVGTINAHSGVGPYLPIWTRPYEGLYARVQDPTGTAVTITVQGFPTAFIPYDSPGGPRLLFKSTDFYFQRVTEGLVTGYYAQSWQTADHIFSYNATNGALLWQRDLNLTPNSPRTNFTWVSGVTDVNGDGEPDVVLDQAWITNPRGNIEQDDPLSGQPLFRWGQGMDVVALDGSSRAAGRTLWTAVVWDDGAARINPPQQEENFEEMRRTHAYVIGDLTGDGVGDVMAQVLTQEGQEETTVNGAFRTHFVPVDGATGALPWGNQVKFQGWGFAARMERDNESRLALGTMDLPTEVPPMSRFPPKDLRLAVLHGLDGTPVWSHQAQYPQDSYVGYDLALQQFQVGLAPYDVDGDGWNDLVTPGQYVGPKPGQQLLLSQATQAYEILSGATGKELRRITGFGSNGLLVPCGPQRFVLVGGYGQHLETSAFDLKGQEKWDAPIWLDPSPTSASAGVDLIYVGARCEGSTDNRTFLSINVGLDGMQRGQEIVPLYGFPYSQDLDEDGNSGMWMTPDFLDKRGLLERLQDLLQPPAPPTTEQRVGWGAIPIVPGLLLGITAGVVANRKKPRPLSLEERLPDLYGGRP